jgi:predicted nucleic acid-binding protein
MNSGTPEAIGEIVVCNSGPLIALAKVNLLRLLQELYGVVLIPNAVWREVRSGGTLVEQERLQSAQGLQVISLTIQPDPLLRNELGPGEAEVIALGRQEHAARLILDERKARRIAMLVFGLRIVGTGGLLLRARREGRIEAIRPVFAQMRQNGYYLGHNLVEGICRAAGE